MKNNNKFLLLYLVVLSFIFCSVGCSKNKNSSEKNGTSLEFEIGDLLAQTLYISGKNTVWIFEYKSFPVVILKDIEKDGFNYILVLENGLSGATTKVSVKKELLLM